MWIIRQVKNTNKGDRSLDDYKSKAKGVVKKNRKQVLSYDTVSDRIMIGGKYYKAFDELAREMGGSGDAFEFLAGCYFGIAIGVDSKRNSRLVQDKFGW